METNLILKENITNNVVLNKLNKRTQAILVIDNDTYIEFLSNGSFFVPTSNNTGINCTNIKDAIYEIERTKNKLLV
jgi:hypothetical protein